MRPAQRRGNPPHRRGSLIWIRRLQLIANPQRPLASLQRTGTGRQRGRRHRQWRPAREEEGWGAGKGGAAAPWLPATAALPRGVGAGKPPPRWGRAAMECDGVGERGDGAAARGQGERGSVGVRGLGRLGLLGRWVG